MPSHLLLACQVPLGDATGALDLPVAPAPAAPAPAALAAPGAPDPDAELLDDVGDADGGRPAAGAGAGADSETAAAAAAAAAPAAGGKKRAAGDAAAPGEPPKKARVSACVLTAQHRRGDEVHVAGRVP